MGRNQFSNNTGTEVFVTLVLLAMMLFGGCAVNAYRCSSVAQQMGFPSSFGPIQGCLLKVDGKWVPKEQYRVLGDVD